MKCKRKYPCSNCEYADIWYSELDGREVATCSLSEEERNNLDAEEGRNESGD